MEVTYIMIYGTSVCDLKFLACCWLFQKYHYMVWCYFSWLFLVYYQLLDLSEYLYCFANLVDSLTMSLLLLVMVCFLYFSHATTSNKNYPNYLGLQYVCLWISLHQSPFFSSKLSSVIFLVILSLVPDTIYPFLVSCVSNMQTYPMSLALVLAFGDT